MADYGQFHHLRVSNDDMRAAAEEAAAFYKDAPRIIPLSCGARGVLDMDGCGYRCDRCFAVVGGMACRCSADR